MSPDSNIIRASSEPEWVRDAMWWHVYPLGFVGADIRPSTPETTVHHRLDRIEAWLDHVIDLGLNGLLLGPVFRSATHGYDTLDHFHVDPRLGGDDDLQRLIDHAKSRGVRVLLDGVFNHVGRGHELFRLVEEDGPDASSADMFRIDWAEWKPGDPVPAEVFEGHDQLVSLNHDSPRVQDLVTDVMVHWLDRGIDGWRLDAAYAVPPRFWSIVLDRVRERHPQAWFTAEVIHGDKTAFVDASGVDSVTQYELWQGIWHGLLDLNLYELAHAIERHTALLDTFIPSTFIGNHDVTRIATAVGHPRHLPHALATLLTVGGIPSIYAGDEYGFRAGKEERFGGDDAVRPEFPAHPFAPSELDADSREVMRLTQELVALRRRMRWLHDGRTEILHRANETLVFRTTGDAGAVTTALHLGDAAIEVPAGTATTVLAGEARIAGGRIHLAPHGWAVLG